MALAGILAGAAQGNAVVDGAVITDFCRFAEHDAHTVVNEQPVADLGTGVDLDAGQVAGQLADEARQEETLVTVQKCAILCVTSTWKPGYKMMTSATLRAAGSLSRMFLRLPKVPSNLPHFVCVLSRISKENTRIS